MGHFGEIRLADPVFSAVVLPSSTMPMVTVVCSSRQQSEQTHFFFNSHQPDTIDGSASEAVESAFIRVYV